MSYVSAISLDINTTCPITTGLLMTCSTTAGTQTKAVTCSDIDALRAGCALKIYFTYANTHASPYIKINGGTAYQIMGDPYWKAGAVIEFVFYNNYMYRVDHCDITKDQSITEHPSSVLTSFSRYMVFNNGVKHCWGNYIIDESDDYNYSIYISFPITFSSKPAVFFSPHGFGESEFLIATVGNYLTTSGFYLNKHAKYRGSVFKFSEGSPDIYWLAIGV